VPAKIRFCTFLGQSSGDWICSCSQFAISVISLTGNDLITECLQHMQVPLEFSEVRAKISEHLHDLLHYIRDIIIVTSAEIVIEIVKESAS